MRHNKKNNHLSRKKGHRRALLANMATSLIKHKRISTTLAKAKALRPYVEPLLTRSKSDNTHNRREVFSHLQDKDAVAELFRDIAPKIADRPGGYTRIIKTGFRKGDAAEMCMIELVDYNEIYAATEKKTKTRRSRRGGGAKAAASTGAKAEAKETAKKEEPKAEKAAPKKDETKKAAPKKEAKAADAPKAEAKKKQEDSKDKKED